MKIDKRSGRGKAMILLGCVLLCGFAPTPVSAQFYKQQHGARNLALANAVTALRDQPWAVYYNPARIRGHDPDVSVFYSPGLFGMQLPLTSAAASYSLPFASVGAALTSFGNDLYRESAWTVGCSPSIDSMFSFGVSLNYFGLAIDRYGRSGTVSADIGFAVDFSESCSVGAFVENVNRPSLDAASLFRLPLVYSFGVAYRPVAPLLFVTDVQKDLQFPVNLRVGVEYLPIPVLALRVGTTSDPSTFSAGVGVVWSRFAFDYALVTHPDLGETHAVSVGYAFMRSE